MEPAKTTASSADPGRTKFQSIDDFMKEQDELDVLKAAEAEAPLVANPTKKQKKAALQAGRERLEAEGKEKKAALQAERERLEAERKEKKALIRIERERLEVEREEKKTLIQIEKELLETEKQIKKVALEAEKRSIEQQANEAVEELGAVNWVGRLLEYRNAHPCPTGGLTYAEEMTSLVLTRFTCIVVIHESSQHFGSGISFLNKRDAKRYASKKAVDWLIENNFMPADGSVKFPKPHPPPIVNTIGLVQSATPSPAGTLKAAPSVSYASQIPELCIRLGFGMPTYEITKHSENTPLWNGYAHFSGDPRIEGKVGEVRSVYGKSNAKEQIAMEVFSFLKDIERQRMEIEDNEEEEDRKRKRESVSSEIGESPGKVVKVET